MNEITQRPDLTGCRVLVGRARPGPSAIASRLRSYGIEVVETPEVFVEELEDKAELDRAILERHQYGAVIFACAASVEAVVLRMQLSRNLVAVPVIAIGEQAGHALRRSGIAPQVQTRGACSPELKVCLSHLAGTSALFFTAEGGRTQLKKELVELGIDVHSVAAYRYMYQFKELMPDSLDAVVIPGSTVASVLLARDRSGALRRVPVIAMGEQSARTARLCGAENVIQAEQDTVDAIVECTVEQLMKDVHRMGIKAGITEELAWKR